MKTLLELGPMGNMPGLNTYILLTLGFPIRGAGEKANAIAALAKAADDVVAAVPWLGGQIMWESVDGEGDDNSGTFRVVEYAPHAGPGKFLRVKEYDREEKGKGKGMVGWEELVENKAPTRLLDGEVFCPGYGFANFYPRGVVTPVVVMQANFINGGLLLTVCTHHCTMDANGNAQFLYQFASLLRGEPISPNFIAGASLDQTTIVPPLKLGEDLYPFKEFRCPSTLSVPTTQPWPPTIPSDGWKTFRFTAANVAMLKKAASKLCDPESDVPYVSSNDAISTFIWSRLANVRSAWLPKDSNTQLVRACNGRLRLDPPIPENYLGHSIICCYTTIPLQNVLNDDFSTTTIKARRTILSTNDNKMRSFFDILKGEKDKTTFNYGTAMNEEADVLLTSFVSQKLYHEGFGSLGQPVFIRRPRRPNAPGLMYMMPATREGHVDLVACLKEKDFEGLKGDERWNEVVEFLG